MRLTKLPKGNVFVFGSNMMGIHGAGAAKDAVQYFGAVSGQGEGLYGQSYAFPTKITPYESMSESGLLMSARLFIETVVTCPELVFHLTPVGTGLGGYSNNVMIRIVKTAIRQVNDEVVPGNLVFTDDKWAVAFGRKLYTMTTLTKH